MPEALGRRMMPLVDRQESPLVDQPELVAQAVGCLSGNADLRALFLAGSLGRGDGDHWSDVDLLAVVAPEAQEGFATGWRSTLHAITPVVLWWTPRGIKALVSAVTQDWLRCDLFMVAPGGLGGRAKSTLAPLIDPDGLHAKLPDEPPPGATSPERVRALIDEFLRVLGLLPVVVGRGEHVTAARGAGLLRDMLMT